MKHKLTCCAAALILATGLYGCRDSNPSPASPTPTPVAAVVEHPSPENAPAPAAPPDVITFDGFGPARFGDDEEAVRMSWGRPLALTGDDPACQYLFIEPQQEDGYRIAYMLEEGRFVRYDVDSDRYTAPGGLKVGSTDKDVEQAHPGRVEREPHKYVDGAQYLIVTPEQGGDARLVLEVSPEGKVTTWRIGVPPAVHYVEGCG